MCRHEKFISKALDIAESNNTTIRMKLGAVVTKGKKILSTGRNHRRTESFSDCRDTIHAEMDALRGVKNTEGACIYVARLGRKLAKPCHRCMKMLRDAGIKRVYYTNEGVIYSCVRP